MNSGQLLLDSLKICCR